MEEAGPTLVIAGVVALIVGCFALVFWINKRRREAWMAAALELDLRYLREDPGFLSQFASFKIFGLGRRRRARNVLSGSRGGDRLWLADYQYTTGSGKQSHTHVQTLCILQSGKAVLPHFFLRRQIRFADFLGKLFGGQDINFDDDPEFSKALVLQGADEQETRALFGDGELRQFCLDRYGRTPFQIECLHDTLLLNPGRTIKPVTARDLAEQGSELLRLLERVSARRRH